MNEQAWNHAVFSKNCEGLSAGDMTASFRGVGRAGAHDATALGRTFHMDGKPAPKNVSKTCSIGPKRVSSSERQVPRVELLRFAQYSVGAHGAAPAPSRHSLCPITTLYSAGINKAMETKKLIGSW